MGFEWSEIVFKECSPSHHLLCFFSLKEQVEEMRKKEERLEKQMNEVMAENRRLIEPLQKAKEEVQELQKQV